MSELGEDELALALREAVEAQLIVVGRDERYGFRHALIREVIYDDLLPGERAELHLRLARKLESTLGEEDHMAIRAAAVAHHYNAAGDQPQALRSAVAAARSVERGGTPGAAAALLDRALALWPRVAEPETLAGLEHVALLARAARAHGLNADEAHAITLYDQALAEVDEAEEPHFFAGLLAEIASVRWAMGQAEKARDNLDRALDLLPESDATPERAMILELKARFLLLQGRFAESRDAADEALRAAEAAGVEGTEALVLNRLGLCLFFLGEEERGDEVMRKSVELARRSGSNDQLATAFVNYADALHFAGRSEEAAAIAAQGSREVTPGDRSALWIACARSAIAFDLGRWDEAEELLPPRNAAQSGQTLTNLVLQRATLQLGRGDTVAARKTVEHARELFRDSVEPQYIAPAGVLVVELELREGHIEAARDAAAKAIDQLEFCSDDAARMAMISAAAALVETEAVERARDLGDAAELEASLARAELMAARTAAAAEEIGRHARVRLPARRRGRPGAGAARRRRAGAGGGRGGGLGRAAASLPGGAGAAARGGSVRRGGRARGGGRGGGAGAGGGRGAGIGVAGARDRGLRRPGAPAARESPCRERQRGGGASAAPRRPTAAAAKDDDPFGLTPRERQVLAALAEGATNREIAAQLFMAEKTASVHVSRILAKLGVRSRTEAAAVAHRLALD